MVIAQASGRVYLSSGMKWIRLRQRRGGGRGRMSSHGRLTGHFMSHNVSYHGSLVDPVWPRGPGVQPCKVPNSQAVPGKRKLQAAVDQPTAGCSEEALGMESHFPPPRYPFVSADQAYICPGERVSVRRRGAVRVGSGRCYLFPGKLTVWRTHVNGQPRAYLGQPDPLKAERSRPAFVSWLALGCGPAEIAGRGNLCLLRQPP